MTTYDLGRVVGENGQDGDDGNGIVSIEKTGTSGLVDTYTITYTDGDTDTFTVTNGSSATVDIVTSWNSTTSDAKVPSEKLAKTSLDGKLDNAISSTAVSIASSDNILITDYSDSNKVKRVANILVTQVKDSNAHSNIGSSANDTQGTINTNIDTALSNKVSKSNTSGLLKNDGTVDTSAYITSSALSGYQTTSNLVTSFSGTTSDSKYPSEKLVKTELDKKIGTSSTSGLVKNDGSIDTSSYITSSAISGKEDTSNKVSSWSSTTNDIHYPTEKLVKDSLDGKQATLVSGTSIKTINNESLLGSGNITIQGGSSVDVVTSWEATLSDTKVPSEKLTKNTIDGKLDNALSSTAVTVASDDNILITDYSDSNKIKRVGNILASQVKDGNIHSNISTLANSSQAVINNAIDSALGNKVSKSSTSGLLKNDGTVDTTSYSTFSGSYNDLSNKPSIPSSSSDLSDGSSLVKTSSTSGLIKNDGSIDTSSYITSSALSGYQTTANLVTSFSSTTSDSKYPSEKLTKTELDKKIAKSSTSGLVKNDGTIDTSSYITSSAITGMLTSNDIANNLTTTTTGKVLDATQGKALKDLIGNAITYINQ